MPFKARDTPLGQCSGMIPPSACVRTVYAGLVGLFPRRYEVTLSDEASGRGFREVVWARGEASAAHRAASWIDAKEKIALYEAPAQVRRIGLLDRPGG